MIKKITMIKKLIIPFSLIILFLGIFYKYNKDIQDNKITEEPNNLNKILNISSDTNKIVLKSQNIYDFYLDKTNLLNLNINENIDELDYVEFDSNRLNMISKDDNITNLTSKYELVPSKNILKIFYKNKNPIMLNLNVIYSYNPKEIEFSDISNHWIYNKECNTLEILPDGIQLGGICTKKQSLLEYKKNFDKNVTLELDLNIQKSKTVDMQFTFGERLYVNFDNKKIKFKRKELYENNKQAIKTVKEINYSRFKNNYVYTIVFSRNLNTYNIKVLDSITKEIHSELEYFDDNKNIKIKQIYNNLRISVGNGNTKILISSIEIY
jgi:hypothetical protein